MQKLLIPILLMIVNYTYGQTKSCDCSGPLKKDLTDQFNNTQYSDFKQFIIKYFKSNKEERQKMKSDKSFSYSNVAQVVIEGLPLEDQTNIDYKESDEKSYYYKLKQLYFENSDIKDEEFNQVISSKMSDNQLTAYLACLKNNCSSNMGVTYITSGDLDDVFSITIIYNAQKGGDAITLKGKAIYSNLKPIGEPIFVDKLKIKDRKSISGIFKRISVNKKATFTINTAESISIEALEIPVNSALNLNNIPIGTIVSSILPYENFLKVNGLDKIDNTNSNKAIWVPCDGRFINNSKYSQVGGPKSPDLRGIFLRGINDYGTYITGTGVETLSEDKKNPDDKKAGEFQGDELESHNHKYPRLVNDIYFQDRANTSSSVTGATKDSFTESSGGNETRPKNITVYFYIKIN